MPKMLRIFFKYKKKLQNNLCLYGVRALLKYFKAVTGKELTPGIVAVIQTFAERMNFHAHLHFLITEGGIYKNGKFNKVTKFDGSMIAKLFCREVLLLLIKENLSTRSWYARYFFGGIVVSMSTARRGQSKNRRVYNQTSFIIRAPML